MSDLPDNVKAIQELATISAGKIIPELDKIPFGVSPAVIIPEGYKLESIEKYLPTPSSIKEHIRCADVDSFLAYWKMFAYESSLIFANQDEMSFAGMLEYHNVNTGASWVNHKVFYTCPKSKEWELWTNKNKSAMSQADFAQFIEDNIEDISQRDGSGPTGAEMLEIATNLEIKNDIKFKSSKRLDNGEVQLTYNEDINGTDRTGQMKIPQEFYLAIPVFKNDSPYSIKARLRYRMSSGSVHFFYDLYRIDKVLDDAFGRVYAVIAEAVGHDKILHGER